jgi:hypothetical protein
MGDNTGVILIPRATLTDDDIIRIGSDLASGKIDDKQLLDLIIVAQKN